MVLKSSTMQLPRALARIYTPEQIVTSCVRLVTLPAVFMQVKSVVDDPRATPMDLSKVIAADPAMSARLLKLINCAFWGFGGVIDSLSRAVSLLGMIHVHDLVLASSVAQTFEGIPTGLMDVERFWRASMFRGLAATALARQGQVVDLGRVFTQALLSNLGHMVLYLQLPELAGQALLQTRAQPWERAQAERALIGCDYAQVGGALCDTWKLPPSFGEAIRHQHDPQAAGDYTLEASLLHIAATLAQGLELEIGSAAMISRIDPFAWDTVQLGPDCLAPILQEVESSLEATTRMFGLSAA